MFALKSVLLCIAALGLMATAAMAEDDFVASLRLRGGYDSNPLFSNGTLVGGAAFVGADTAMAAARKADGYSLGLAVEASDTQYANQAVVPSMSGKVILRGMLGNDDANLSSTTTLSDVNNYSVRASDFVQSIKAEMKTGNVKMFVTAEGASSSLNQTNAIFQDFLPSPEQYLRGTLIPGISYLAGKFEIGTSVNLSMRRYLDELDVFGYRRDNERVQPFLFARYADTNLTITGAVSQLYGTWHDVDFSNVKELLFDGKVNWTVAPVTINLSASRQANETTFPISPITIDSIYTGKLSWDIDSKTTLSAATGYYTTVYLDSPYESQTSTYGVGVSRDLFDGLTAGLNLTYVMGTLISGEKATATVISTSLTKKFSPFAKDVVKDVVKDAVKGMLGRS